MKTILRFCLDVWQRYVSENKKTCKKFNIRKYQLQKIVSFLQHNSVTIFQKKSIFESNQFALDEDWFFEVSSRPKERGSRCLLQSLCPAEETIPRSRSNKAKKIDEYSRVIYPLLFFLFMALYWPMILLKKNTSENLPQI